MTIESEKIELKWFENESGNTLFFEKMCINYGNPNRKSCIYNTNKLTNS